ncbi:AraC family transcriptional regulator N-terminal domain-containing protein [Marinomonas dokdonensis]|uniref:AraC family transcriptional regulator N-terminal domain-containing protein n=1 Tax=Marinomonas dokdonensis TaxID=328224 RepID=UPI0040555CE0
MTHKIQCFNDYVNQLLLGDGYAELNIKGVGVFQASQRQAKRHAFYEPLICLMGQGAKRCHVGDSAFTYQAGDFFINFLPMPVSTEVVQAEKDKPLLSASLAIDLVRLADMVLRIERIEGRSKENANERSSSLVMGKADDELVDLFIKLLKLSRNPMDAKILGESVIDEIYYRILTSEHGYALRTLLSQYGGIQPISRVVGYIHENTEKSIQIQELANIANMSKTSFFNAFKQIMHVPPMQYIKSSKLQKAQTLLIQGMSANEASFQVGYNSFSQFSREYKRFFGYPPSHTQRAA